MKQLDTLTQIETPEGVVLTMSIAGPVPRALAWVIDALVRYAVLTAVLFTISRFGSLGTGLFVLTWFAMEWFYPVLFEGLHGATPGKRRMGLLVVHDDGTPLTWSAAMLRNLLRAVDFLPFLYGIGLGCALMHPQFKRLGDLAAGTLVIHAPQMPPRRRLPSAPPHLPAIALSMEEQRAIVDFAERSAGLSPARAEELAQHLTGLRGEQARQRALAYANGLAQW